MKGLLLKDWYMMKKYCRYYLFCAVGFTVLSVMSSGNMFFNLIFLFILSIVSLFLSANIISHHFFDIKRIL